MRLATLDDLPTIGKELSKLIAHATTNYGFISTIDSVKALSALAQEIRDGNGYIVGNYLVMIAEVAPWYSNDKVLQEWFTMKLCFRAYGRELIPGCLLEVAKHRGCTHIMTADSSAGHMAKQWADSGLTPLTQSFYSRV